MNELVVMNNQPFAFRNEELVQSVNRIRAYSRSMEESSFQIALELKHIKDNELYKEDGYSNIIEFSSKVFGYRKTTTYYLLTMAENLLVSQGEEVRTIFARDNQDFSVNQLREMITLDIGTIEELVKSEKLVPNMSIKQIRKTVKSKKKEKNLEVNQIPDVGKTENRGINLESTIDITVSSISSSSSSSVQSEEENKRLEIEISRLKEENYKLAHPTKRKRGRPRKVQD